MSSGELLRYMDVKVDALPSDVNSLISTLQKERVVITYWLKLAVRNFRLKISS